MYLYNTFLVSKEWVSLCQNLILFFSVYSCKELNNLLLQYNKIKCIGKVHEQPSNVTCSYLVPNAPKLRILVKFPYLQEHILKVNLRIWWYSL